MTILKIFFVSIHKRLSKVSLFDSHGWKLELLGLNKIFRYIFMTLLKLFYFMIFSSCPFKKRSTGKPRLSKVSRFDSECSNYTFWASKKILGIH